MRRKISNLGRADDIRKKYRDAMRDERFKFPRNNMLSHGVGWYLDGHLISRPLTAVYAFANLAEYMLYYARHGRRGQRGAETAAVEFFAETRRSMQNVLSSYPLDRRLRPNERESVGKVAIRLCDHAKITWDELGSATKVCNCPACRGTRKLYGADAELLEAILREQSRNGTIPPTSKLFRSDAVDNPPRTVV